ncbi:MAG: hypothetical protein AAGA10_04655 [Bacteroidota bacterium]
MHWKNLWKELTPHPLSSIKQATEQYHHAIQFIAMCGNNLLPGQTDDSQTNLEWWPDRSSFSGRRIPGKPTFRLVLDTQDFSLIFYRDVRHPGEYLSLDGLNEKEVYSWVNDMTLRKGSHTGSLRRIQHYRTPPHPLSEGATFTTPSSSAQDILAAYRSNADLILAHMAAKFPSASPVRVWPHHFDTGSSVPLTFDTDSQISEAVGFGLAIPDMYTPDYYFYVNFLAKESKLPIASFPTLEGLGKWHTEGWVGRILPLSKVVELSSSTQQAEAVEGFFYHGVDAVLGLLGKASLKPF